MNPHLKAVLSYIIDFEGRDFEENPSDIHVYYHALAFAYGNEYADEILKEAILKTENE